jgi:hypothetical protein
MPCFAKKIQLLFFVVFITLSLKGQENSFKERLYVEGNYHYGFITPHLKYISYFIEDHIKGIQLNVGITTTGKEKWHYYYNYPKLGIGFYHSGLGNDKVYGKLNALFFFVDRCFFKQNNRFNLNNRIAFGLAYINKKYDLRDNYFDMAIGSNINVYINYSLEGLYRLSPYFQVKMGVGLTHTSNGHVKEPNKGLNMATSTFGLVYSFKKPLYLVPDNFDEEKEKNQFTINAIFGVKQISRYYDKTYLVEAFSAEYERKLSRTIWLGPVLTYYHDPSIIEEQKLDKDSVAYSIDGYRIALNLSLELKIGNLSYLIQPGYYLKNDYRKVSNMTNKIGLRYKFTNRLTAGVAVKAHWFAIADFIEWGIGYQLSK